MTRPDQQSTLPYAIVIGLDCITGLQTARILAGHNIPIIAIARNLDHYCCRTNVCEEIIQADTASEGFICALETLGPKLQQKAVLYTCTDMSVLTLSRHRQRLARWYHVALPEPDVIEMLVDKVRFYTYADKAELPIPKTFILENRTDAEKAMQEIPFPSILKPPIKTPGWEKQTKAKVFKVNSPEEALAVYDQCASWADTLIIQEWVEGNDATLYSCYCYFNAVSEPLVTFTARKIRQWPPRTGTSSSGEECRNDVVLEESLRLFRGVNYRGLGQVEMKRDDRTGKHFIIEPNLGRPTARSSITEAGGVDLLYTMYCDCVNLPLPKNRQQKYTGAKWIYLRRDIQSALYYWMRGELTIKEWWQFMRGPKYDAVFSWSDPAPFWYDILKVIGLLIKRNNDGSLSR